MDGFIEAIVERGGVYVVAFEEIVADEDGGEDTILVRYFEAVDLPSEADIAAAVAEVHAEDAADLG